MAKKLYVGGLSYSTNEDSLKEYFSQAGAVESCSVIMDKFTGRSKGFGFVEMSTDDEAQAAVEMFNGKDFEGRALTVNEARPMEDRPARRPGGGSGGGSRGFGSGGGSGGGGSRGGFSGGSSRRSY
jgi:RNA recognition motif-containing protein